MRYVVASLLLGAAIVTACGTDGTPIAQVDTPSRSSGCRLDSDCPAGQSCRSVRVGEVEERSCVADAVDEDAGPPLGDATVPPSNIADAANDAPPVVGDDAGDASIIPDDAGAVCHKALTVSITASGPLPSCTFNTAVVESSPATLDYVCDGGPAQATFGPQTFTGTLTGGALTIQNVTTYSIYIDAQNVTCYYNATQTISGTLASGTLSYDYSEELASGQPALCKFVSAACYESGPVTSQ